MHVVFGGSFDPVHEGHLRTAAAVRQYLQVDRLYLLPAARSPLKPVGTADQHRLAMLQIALADYPGLLIDDRELHRPPPSYTVDTLRQLRAVLGDSMPLVWVTGADTLCNLSQWKDWQAIATLAHLVIVDRPGAVWPAQGAVARWLSTLPSANNADQLQCAPAGKRLRLVLPPQPFSSTAIRNAVEQRTAGSARPAGLPAGVWHYILEHHLYQSGCGHEAQ